MANQSIHDVLAVSFACPADVVKGDMVEMASDLTVKKVAQIGAHCVGMVDAHAVHNLRYPTVDAHLTCTVATPFRTRRKDRVAGAVITVGPFVFGPANKVYPFTAGAPAVITAANAGPYAIVEATSDALKVTVGSEAAQTFALTPGAAITAAALAAEINATAVGFTASVNAAGKLVLTANAIGVPLTIGAVTHDCYTVVGLTAAGVNGTYPSHCPSKIAGICIKGGAKDAVVETLEY